MIIISHYDSYSCYARMKINKYRVYDVVHKSVVSSLIAFTAVGTVYLGYKAVHWFTGESEFSVL